MTNYREDPDPSFWETFPKNPMPQEVSHSLDLKFLTELLYKTENSLTMFQFSRALRCIESFVKGAPSCQKVVLPACSVKNANSTYEHGPAITDTVASWGKKNFTAGPFDFPPTENFRVNGLQAIDQGEKIRPVLNVSLPVNESFNDNVNIFSLEKVYMSNAKKFGYSVCDAGKDSKMSKYDLVDAYKNVPAPIFDLRLQGFSWLGKFFVETRQIFGAKTAVCNYDIFGNTLLTLTCTMCKIPSTLVHRTLDDVPIVAPVNTVWCEEFSDCYEKLCENIGVKLAAECPKKEKAFKNSTNGKVLGILFDTTTLKWSLPKDKRQKALMCIEKTLNERFLNLKDHQILMGRLNDITQMCPFLKGFKQPLNKILSLLESKKFIRLSHEAKKDLLIWKNFLLDPDVWLPICPRYTNVPIASLCFCSDAAGWSVTMKENGKIGCGNVGFNQFGEVIFAYQILWNNEIISMARDCMSKRLGDKTTSLEFLGILLPFLVIPEQLCNKYIVVKVDNTGCYFGWLNRQVPGDEIASVLVRSLHLIEARLGSRIHIEHLPRKMTWEAALVDRMSRERSTTSKDKEMLRSFEFRKIPQCLENWMKNPRKNWMLAEEMLHAVCEIIDSC